MVFLTIHEDEFLLKVEQLRRMKEELVAVLQLIVLTNKLGVPLERSQELEQLYPLEADRQLPIVFNDDVEDLEEAPLELNREAQDVVFADYLGIDCIHLYAPTRVVLALRVVA